MFRPKPAPQSAQRRRNYQMGRTGPIDPFQHEPALRDRIVAPENSAHRGMDSTLLAQQMAAAGVADWLRPERDQERSRTEILDGRRDADLWVSGSPRIDGRA